MRNVQDLIDEWERGDDEPPADVDFGGLAKQAIAKATPEPDADEQGGPSDKDSDDLPDIDFGNIAQQAIAKAKPAGASMAESTRVAPASFSAAPDASEIGDAVSAPRIPPIKPVSAISPPADRGSRSAAAAPAPSSDAPTDPSKMDWKQLGDALSNAQLRGMQTRAASNMFENIAPGYKADLGWGELQSKLAGQPLELAKAKQGMESQAMTAEAHRAAMEDRRKAAGVKEAMDNPNSLQSQKAREAWKAFGLPMPPGFDSWSANDVQRYSTGAAGARTVAEKNADDAAKKAAAERAAVEKAAGEKASLEASRKNFAKELQSIGIDPSNASQKDIERALTIRGQNMSNADRDALRALAEAARRDKDEDRGALKNAIPFADGELRYTGGGTPREDDKREAQKVSKASNGAIAGMNDLEKAMAAFATNPSAATRDDVVAKTRVVSGALNTAAEQGAMSKDEAEEMAKALGVSLTSPGSLGAAWERVFGNEKEAAASMTRRVKSVRDSVKKVAIGKAKVFGFDFAPSGGGGGSSGGGAPASDVEETRVINGRTYRKKGGKWVTDA